MLLPQTGLSAACLMLMCACSTTPSTLPTTLDLPQTPPPEACLQPCPRLPHLADGQEVVRTSWEHEAAYLYGTCRRLHEACRSAPR